MLKRGFVWVVLNKEMLSIFMKTESSIQYRVGSISEVFIPSGTPNYRALKSDSSR